MITYIIVIVIFSWAGFIVYKRFIKKKILLPEVTPEQVSEQKASFLKEKYMDLLRKMISSLSHNYDDIEIIDEGGMGVIASAFDKDRNRKVAIKTILPELNDDSGVVGLFLQECQVIQAMNHPNVVRIYEVGKSEFLYYYVMDFLEGETLQDLMDKKNILAMGHALRIGTQVARALQHIHSNGLIHRDIKPSNIFITDKGIAKIIDFGIAKLLNAKTAYNYSSVGSPLYASPEQIQGEEVSGKSDIYSLGVVIFYMLTGTHPFSSADLLAKMFEAPKNIKELNQDVPDHLAKIVNLCINIDPMHRLPAHELWARLRAIANEVEETEKSHNQSSVHSQEDEKESP